MVGCVCLQVACGQGEQVKREKRETLSSEKRDREDLQIYWVKGDTSTTAIRLWSQCVIHTLKHSTPRLEFVHSKSGTCQTKSTIN